MEKTANNIPPAQRLSDLLSGANVLLVGDTLHRNPAIKRGIIPQLAALKAAGVSKLWLEIDQQHQASLDALLQQKPSLRLIEAWVPTRYNHETFAEIIQEAQRQGITIGLIDDRRSMSEFRESHPQFVALHGQIEEAKKKGLPLNQAQEVVFATLSAEAVAQYKSEWKQWKQIRDDANQGFADKIASDTARHAKQVVLVGDGHFNATDDLNELLNNKNIPNKTVHFYADLARFGEYLSEYIAKTPADGKPRQLPDALYLVHGGRLLNPQDPGVQKAATQEYAAFAKQGDEIPAYHAYYNRQRHAEAGFMARRACAKVKATEVKAANPDTPNERALLNRVASLSEQMGINPPPLVFVYDTPVINAFSVYGSFLGFTRGAIEQFDNQSMDALIAHELSHHQQNGRDWLIKGTLFAGGMSAGYTFGKYLLDNVFGALPAKGLGGSLKLTAQIYGGVLAGLGMMTPWRHFSEYEADRTGAEYTTPDAMRTVLSELYRHEKNHKDYAQNTPDKPRDWGHTLFFTNSSHPPIEERISRLQSSHNAPRTRVSEITSEQTLESTAMARNS